jgi:sugar phosphate isomerase/epimerase
MMMTRRRFLGKALVGISAGATVAAPETWGAGRLAWTKPIGLEMYTVRDQFAQDPAGTLKRVGATGYREVELGVTEIPAATLKGYLSAAHLTAPSTYIDVPTDAASWRATLSRLHPYGFRYIVVGDNPQLDAEAWIRRAALFNECGRLARGAGMQFCYHAHFHEFAPLGNTCGYDIMLTRCDPEFLKMEMDIFWATYAGQDPIAYFEKYPGRFPLLHIKDLKPGFPSSTKDFPYDTGPNPFAPAGQGRIDWVRIFAHTRLAGARHIFVEQDRCDTSPFVAIRTSFNYLKNLRLS